MKLTIKPIPFIFGLFLIGILACNIAKPVAFKSYVDTSSKPVSYQQKRTFSLPQEHIYASNQFDGARLNGFELLNDSTASVIINPENVPVNPSPYYAFKVWSDTTKVFYFTLTYPKGFKHRYIPKINVGSGWNAIDSTSIYHVDSIVTIKLNLSKKPTMVAAQEIQSSADVKNWYEDLIEDTDNLIHPEIFGKSKLGRELPVLDIYRGTRKNKPVIVLLTRQHPPEVTGFFAFQEFLKTLVRPSELSKEFFDKYRVLAFPIMNPDGVDLGHWRHNAGGIDLNRDWSKYNQPEIRQTVAYIDKTLKKEKARLILGLDFHSTLYDVFYTNTERASTALPHFVEDWFHSLEANIPAYKVNEQSANSNKPVSKGWFLNAHQAVGITYEIGDNTSKEDIKTIGKTSAEQMMRILLNN